MDKLEEMVVAKDKMERDLAEVKGHITLHLMEIFNQGGDEFVTVDWSKLRRRYISPPDSRRRM